MTTTNANLLSTLRTARRFDNAARAIIEGDRQPRRSDTVDRIERTLRRAIDRLEASQDAPHYFRATVNALRAL